MGERVKNRILGLLDAPHMLDIHLFTEEGNKLLNHFNPFEGKENSVLFTHFSEFPVFLPIISWVLFGLPFMVVNTVCFVQPFPSPLRYHY